MKESNEIGKKNEQHKKEEMNKNMYLGANNFQQNLAECEIEVESFVVW